jgi:hypothetical protein
MRTLIAVAALMTSTLVAPAFAQNTMNPGAAAEGPRDTAPRGQAPNEGRAATHDETTRSDPNGSGNALEGPNHAPNSTRNNGQ